MQHLIHSEAPVFIVVSSVVYRALVVAAGSQHITQWYPRIVAKVRAEVQEGLHGFIRWLNTNSSQVSLSTAFRCPLQQFGLSIAPADAFCVCLFLSFLCH